MKARAILAIGVIALCLAGCSNLSLLAPAGPIGAAQRTIILNAMFIMLCIIVPTIIVTIAFAWWYREGNQRASYDPRFVYSGPVELVVWSIPILVVLYLSGVAWISSHQLEPSRPLQSAKPTMEVQVVNLDWKWLFIYPEQNVATVNRIVAPVGTPVRLRITSASVFNTFFVPRLGSMIYAMPGMAVTLHLQADQPGSFTGRGGHFSGDGFPTMFFQWDAVSDADFQRFVGEARANPALDRAAYDQLKQQSVPERPFAYGRVEAGLFEAIATQRIPPAPGPVMGEGRAPVDVRPSGEVR